MKRSDGTYFEALKTWFVSLFEKAMIDPAKKKNSRKSLDYPTSLSPIFEPQNPWIDEF